MRFEHGISSTLRCYTMVYNGILRIQHDSCFEGKIMLDLVFPAFLLISFSYLGNMERMKDPIALHC